MWAWRARSLRPRLGDDAGVLLFQEPEKRSWSPGGTRFPRVCTITLTHSTPDALFIPTTRYLSNSTCNRCLPTAIIDSVRSHFPKPVGPGMCMTDNLGMGGRGHVRRPPSFESHLSTTISSEITLGWGAVTSYGCRDLFGSAS